MDAGVVREYTYYGIESLLPPTYTDIVGSLTYGSLPCGSLPPVDVATVTKLPPC